MDGDILVHGCWLLSPAGRALRGLTAIWPAVPQERRCLLLAQSSQPHRPCRLARLKLDLNALIAMTAVLLYNGA